MLLFARRICLSYVWAEKFLLRRVIVYTLTNNRFLARGINDCKKCSYSWVGIYSSRPGPVVEVFGDPFLKTNLGHSERGGDQPFTKSKMWSLNLATTVNGYYCQWLPLSWTRTVSRTRGTPVIPVLCKDIINYGMYTPTHRPCEILIISHLRLESAK